MRDYLVQYWNGNFWCDYQAYETMQEAAATKRWLEHSGNESRIVERYDFGE